MSVNYSLYMQEQVLTVFLLSPQIIDGTDKCKIGLFVNNINPTTFTTIGELVEPTAEGYSRKAVIFTSPRLTDTGDVWVTLSSDADFSGMSPEDPITVYGAFLVNAADADAPLLMVEKFAQPQTITSTSDQIFVKIRLTNPQSTTAFILLN